MDEFSSQATKFGLAAREAVRDLVDVTEGLPTLAELAYTRRVLEECIAEQVRISREAGASWTEVGDALKISKQAAWERYGRG